MSALDTLKSWSDEYVALRHDLHQHPEIGFTETRTSAVVAEHLRRWGIETNTGLGKTGVVGVIRKGTRDRAIALRADMDALPIVEQSGAAHTSLTPGIMHGCGHDGHTTMLLAAARYLALHAEFDGTVHLVFQPAEEGLGGAKAMLDDGLFTRFPSQEAYGMHNAPDLRRDDFRIQEGPAMASAASFEFRVHGKGAHGALPENSVDTVLVASALVVALQSIVSRNVPAAERAVLSVTTFHSGVAFNVIPALATLTGTVRTFSVELMTSIEARMRSVADGVAATYGARIELDFHVLFAPLVNSAQGTKAMADAAAALVGEDRVDRQGGAMMGSEDFSYMLQAVPGALIWLGTSERPDTPLLHSPYFDFNDAVIPLGAALWVELVEQQLAVNRS